MSRIFSIVVILAVATLCMPNTWSDAQEAKQKCLACKECQPCPTSSAAPADTGTIERLDVDIPGGLFEIQVAVQQDGTPGGAATAEACFEIDCELCETEIPFLSSLPVMGGLFKNVGLKTNDGCCPDSKSESCPDGCCPDSKPGACPNGCCHGSKDDICIALNSVTKCESCDCCPAAASSATSNHQVWIAKTDCTPADGCKACPMASNCNDCELGRNPCAGCPSTCPVRSRETKGQESHSHEGQLVGYVEPINGKNPHSHHTQMREEMFELRIQNERLKMDVEVAEERLELMESVMEMREENVLLRARLEFYEAQYGELPKKSKTANPIK